MTGFTRASPRSAALRAATAPGPTEQPVVRGATISPCGRYRYDLWRTWGPEPHLLFVLLNPSTADAQRDDPTVRRCIGFARRFGAGGVGIVNLYARRSSDPRDLWHWSEPDPVGPENDEFIGRAASLCDCIVCAWGAFPRATERGRAVYRMLDSAKVRVLGTTKAGHPRHPLYLPGEAGLLEWSGP